MSVFTRGTSGIFHCCLSNLAPLWNLFKVFHMVLNICFPCCIYCVSCYTVFAFTWRSSLFNEEKISIWKRAFCGLQFCSLNLNSIILQLFISWRTQAATRQPKYAIYLLPNALFKSILHIFDCYTIFLQLLGERGTVKIITPLGNFFLYKVKTILWLSDPNVWRHNQNDYCPVW